MLKPVKKCLSLWQPFASLLIMGIKTVDTRGYATPKGYTGELYIHASAAFPRSVVYDEYYLGDPTFRLIVNLLFFFEESRNLDPVPWAIFRKGFTMGKILGRVTLLPAMEAHDLKEEWGPSRLPDWEREYALGDLSSDRWAWPVEDPRVFAQPVDAKGTISPLLWDASKYLPVEVPDCAFIRNVIPSEYVRSMLNDRCELI